MARRRHGFAGAAVALGVGLLAVVGRAGDPPAEPVESSERSDEAPAAASKQPPPPPSSPLTESVAALTRLSLAVSYASLPPVTPLAIAGWANTGGGLKLTDGLSLVGSRSELTLGSGPSGRQTTEVYDVSATIDAIDIAEVSFSLVGGVRVATAGPVDADATQTAITPVLGPAMRWRRGPSELRAIILGDATGANEDFVEFRVEQVWHLATDATLSLGYQHQRSLFQDPPVRTSEKRDAFSIELRLNF